MTPVILLSDGYIANGSEPWKFPDTEHLHPIEFKFKTELGDGEDKLQPYLRDEKGVRPGDSRHSRIGTPDRRTRETTYYR